MQDSSLSLFVLLFCATSRPNSLPESFKAKKKSFTKALFLSVSRKQTRPAAKGMESGVSERASEQPGSARRASASPPLRPPVMTFRRRRHHSAR